MITLDVLMSKVSGLSRADLELWVSNDWVRPEATEAGFSFGEIDVARVILIQQLRDDLEVNDAALPVVLSLVDQLYDLRRHMRYLGAVMQHTVPSDMRAKIVQAMAALDRQG